VQKLEAALEAVSERLKEQEAKIRKVSAQIELSSSTSQTVANHQLLTQNYPNVEEGRRRESMIPFLSAGLHFKLMVVCERRSLASATFCGSSYV
jgi:hypothetical protein